MILEESVYRFAPFSSASSATRSAMGTFSAKLTCARDARYSGSEVPRLWSVVSPR